MLSLPKSWLLQVLQLLQPSMYLVVSIKTKHEVAQASLSGSIFIGLVFLCLLNYNQGSSDALQLLQSASWTHTDARSICDVSSAKWSHFALSMEKLTMELSLSRYSIFYPSSRGCVSFAIQFGCISYSYKSILIWFIMRYDYDDKDGDNTIMSMTTISVSVHFRDLLLQLQHLLLYLSEVCCITVYKSGV